MLKPTFKLVASGVLGVAGVSLAPVQPLLSKGITAIAKVTMMAKAIFNDLLCFILNSSCVKYRYGLSVDVT
jgi:hypothetical protein